jgi:hypothetical protein
MIYTEYDAVCVWMTAPPVAGPAWRHGRGPQGGGRVEDLADGVT